MPRDSCASSPCYKVLFVAVLAGLAVSRRWQFPPLDWRVLGLATLWLYFLFTTYHAKVEWAAWPRFAEITKIFLSLGLTLVLIDTRQKLFFLIVAIATSFALVTLKGGYWAVMTGFADRVYGPPDSQYYDNNLFAVAVVMNIPLLVLWLRETREHRGTSCPDGGDRSERRGSIVLVVERRVDHAGRHHSRAAVAQQAQVPDGCRW